MTDLERKQSQLIYNLKCGKIALENENWHLNRALKEVRSRAYHCDADERCIQPYEVIDPINQVLSGENHVHCT